MIKLNVVRFATFSWERAIRISNRLSPTTWKRLACVSLTVTLLSYLGMRQSIKETSAVDIPTPRTSVALSPIPRISSISPSAPAATNADQNVQVFGSNFQSGLVVEVTRPNGTSTLSGAQIQSIAPGSVAFSWSSVKPVPASTMKPGLFAIYGHLSDVDTLDKKATDLRPLKISLDFMGSPTSSVSHAHLILLSDITDSPSIRQTSSSPEMITALHSARDRRFSTRINFAIADRLKSFLQPTVVVLGQSEANNDWKNNLLFWMSLFGLIVSPITNVSTLVFTWISLRRRRAEEILLRLQVQKCELEIQQLRAAIWQQTEQPKLILASS